MMPIDHRGGTLYVEDVPAPAIADAVGTPAYVYSTAVMSDRYTAFADAFAGTGATICYALKANSNQAVIKTLADLGAGADVVSEGEMRRALAAGIPPDRIVFSGVGKTAGEMEAAIAAGIGQMNVESLPELETLSAVAARLGATVRTSVRVNPDVDARTHEKITTGKRENKFGVELHHAVDAFARAADLPGIDMRGVAVHIGSQLTDLAPFRQAFRKVADLVAELRRAGFTVDHLDLGGGLGVSYADDDPPPVADYAAMIREVLGPLNCQWTFEPGRALVAEAGIVLTRVLYVKPGETRTFVIVDAAMNDLLRPSLYDAHHMIQAVEDSGTLESQIVDIVGPVCETGDRLALSRALPPVAPGDLLAVRTAGAYGAVMASTYNSRLLVPEVLVRGGDVAVVRPRQTYDALLAQDRLPPWLEPINDRQRAAG